MSLLDSLPHTCTAKRRKRSKGTLVGSKDTYPTVLFTDRPCWKQPASSREITLYQKRDITITNKVYFSTDPEVDERHLLVIGGESFEVREYAHPDASAGLGLLYRVMVELVRTSP
jgi:hypothetical protein